MLFYFAIAGLLWIAAFAEALDPASSRRFLIPIIIALTVVSGLRFETGYDWLIYERFFNESPTILDILSGSAQESVIPVEPLFSGLNIIFKSLGSNLQFLMATAAAFNFVVFYKFLIKTTRTPIVIIAAYFGWIFLSLHMAALRQSIAISLILLALMQLDSNHKWRYFMLVSIGTGFQYSAVIFLPMYWVLRRRPPAMVVYAIIAILLTLYSAKVSFVQYILDAISVVTPSSLSEKIDFYNRNFVPERSLGAAAYAVFNDIIFGVGLTYFRKKIPNTPINNALLNLSLIFCLVHTLSAEVPVLWQRLQYVAFAGQITLAAIIIYRNSVASKIIFCALTSTLTISYMVFQLTSEWARPYIPYQNYIAHLVTGDLGDGRQRTEEYYDELQFLNFN